MKRRAADEPILTMDGAPNSDIMPQTNVENAMQPEDKSSSTLWVIIGVVVAMACCLCLVVALSGSALLGLWTFRASSTGTTDAVVTVEAQPATPAYELVETPVPLSPEAETMAQELADTLVPIADPISLAERLMGLSNVPRVLATQAAPIPLGTVQTFWASNVDTNDNFQIDAELVYATPHVYFWVESGVDYDKGDVQELVDEFENHIYPTDRDFFGSEWRPGVDGDPHLYMLFARGIGDTIAGYFASSDEFPPQVHEYSNGHEMFYLSADNLHLGDEFTSGVLAHEFQHMIQWHLDANEESWLNEGFSELASFINGFDVGGMDFVYLQDPDITLTYWPSEPGTSGPHYGQAFLLTTYFMERFGSEATRALTANVENGLESIDETLASLGASEPDSGEMLTADEVFRDWAVALLQDGNISDSRYRMDSYDLPLRPRFSDDFSECPLDPQRRDVSQYGLDYIRITCEGEYELRFDGTPLNRVIPADPHSGDYAFWSNKGDESDMTLTREFDFSGVEGALTFDYWLWYDIEEGWDYLYLEISTDGGDTWSILTTPSGTDEDPSGNSFGWGYNGYSGGGSSPEWINEQVDLSDYAGEQVLLRFEYVTDAAVNGEGLLLDDPRIRAIDYEDDFEAGEGGWESAGFVRLYNEIPQTYRLTLLTRNGQTGVQEIQLDESQAARIPINVGGDVQEYILIVAGTARHTWQPAPYRISILP
jgi:immune inhibitor A